MSYTILNDDDAAVSRLSSDYAAWVSSVGGTVSVPALRLAGKGIQVCVKQTYKDLVYNKTKSVIQWLSSNDGSTDALPTFPVDSSVLSALSTSGLFLANLRREEKKGEEKGKFLIDIWEVSSGALLKTIYLDSSLHGDVLADGWFSVDLVWSGDDKYLAYVAEGKVTSTGDPLFDVPSSSTTPATSSPPPSSLRARVFDYDLPGGAANASTGRESWGEKYENVRLPRIFIVDVAASKVAGIPNVDETLSLGQPSWYTRTLADGNVQHLLAYTAWPSTPRRLGMIYCYNRPCEVRVCNLTLWITRAFPAAKTAESAAAEEVHHTTVSSAHRIARGGRWIHTPASASSETTGCLMFLSMSGIGEYVHNAASDVNVASIGLNADNNAIVLQQYPIARAVDHATEPLLNSSDNQESGLTYPSIYAHLPNGRQLAANANDGCVYLTTLVRSQHRVVAINTSKSAVAGENVRLLPLPDGTTSVALLGITSSSEGNTHVVCVASSPVQPDRLYVMQRRADGEWAVSQLFERKFAHTPAHAALGLTDITLKLKSLAWKYIDVPDIREFADAIAVYPQHAKQAPVVIVPHGGPHSTLPAEFIASYAFLAQKGFCVVLVNFRGSLGFGEAGTASLPGKAGCQDVDDVHSFTRAALHQLGEAADSSRVGIVGGSHGGFLAAHGIGQHPELYNVAVLRNPVTNIATMASATDIPDWCFVEGVGPDAVRPGEPLPPVTADSLQRMFNASPMFHVRNMKAPALFTVGMKDRRVPPFQALELYQALKAQGCVTRLLAYPEDVHAIDKPAAEADAWVNITLWLASHLQVDV